LAVWATIRVNTESISGLERPPEHAKHFGSTKVVGSIPARPIRAKRAKNISRAIR